MLWSVCVFVLLLAVVSGVVVNTRYGALRGTRHTIDADTSVDVFYNVPYAKPPVGPLRFKPPVPNEAWTGTRDATSPGPWCPQKDDYDIYPNETYFGEEDCLYLNVYSPQTTQQSGPLPVLVWIHGGGFYVGAGVQFNATFLAAKGVVAVSVNYRLSALGFLSTEDGLAVGNFGLRDQVLALQWIRDVISAFNGDPQDVTIFGESAGSACVSHLVTSSETRGLFNKAIMESGVSLSSWTISLPGNLPRPRDQARWLATALGCDVTDSSVMVTCLRTKSPTAILEKTTEITAEHYNLAFVPVVEGSFGQSGMYSTVPEVILSQGFFNNVTVIRGFTKDEYAGLIDGSLVDPENDGMTMEEFLNLTRSTVRLVVDSNYTDLTLDRLMDLLVDTYVTQPAISDPDQLRDAYIQLMSDFYFVAPTYKQQQLFSRAHGKTQYLYRFSYRSAHRINREWQGAAHGDDVGYVFGVPFMDEPFWSSKMVSSWTDVDRQVSDRMMTMWTDFAKFGTPTPEGSAGTIWLPWTQETPQLLDIGASSTMIPAVETAGIRLWNDVIIRHENTAVGAIIG